MLQLGQFARKVIACSMAMALVLVCIFSYPQVANGQEASATQTGQTSTQAPLLPGGFLLDLSSQTASIPASGAAVLQTGGTLGADGTVSGGTTQQLEPGQLLTPAQSVALQQVTTTGHQQLVLNASGQAVGGFASLTPTNVTTLGQLTIPTGVSLNSIGFTQSSPFNVTGAVNVQGSLFALQTAANVMSVFNFGSLTVGSGGLISTQLPSYANVLQNVVASSGLTMNVAQNVLNNGTISTAGTLNINAGGTITNQSLNGVQAIISAQLMNLTASTILNSGQLSALQALNNINLNATSILNEGSIVSRLGSIHVLTNELTGSGLMQALNGDIAISSITDSLNVRGGVLDSLAAKFVSPNGKIIVDADRITAPVTIDGGIASVGTHSGDLTIASLNLTGDPIFYSGGGNLDLTGVLPNGGTFSTAGGDFVALAYGSIIAPGITNPTTVDTSAASLGGAITLAAGTNFSILGPTNCSSCAANYSITGPSGAAGSIVLPNVSFLTNSNNVSFLANGGNITIGSVSTSTSNSGNTSGNLTISASGSVSTGSLQTAGINNANGGSITMNSGTGSFNLNSIYTRSTDNSNFNACANCAGTGAGTPGSLIFQQGGIPVSPTVNFATGSEIMLDGSSSLSTSSISLTLANANQMGTISTANAGSGTAGNITINGLGNVNLGFGGAWVVSSALNGGTAGSITIGSPGTISTGILDAAGINGGKGGNILLDSGTGTFQLQSLYTRSTDNTNTNPCAGCASTGTGSSGTLTFRQSGFVLANPNVSFAIGSEIMLDGSNAGASPSVALNLANTNQLGTINVRNAALGQNGGNVTLSGSGAVNLGFNGAWVSTAALNGGRAGDISITSPAAISTNVLDAAGINNGIGGNISLDSGTGSFALNSIYTRSTNNTNWTACAGCAGTGGGASGTITFKQSGIIVANPTVNFATGSEILVDGSNAGVGPSIRFRAANTNQLATINTANAAAGQTAGNITISGVTDVNLGYNGAWVSASALNGGTAGNITISSPGAISTALIDAAAINNGKGGNITLDSAIGSFATGSLYTRSTDNTNWDPCGSCSGTGSGTSGTITFKQSGVTLATPTVSFLTGSDVMVDGTNAGVGPSISFISGNANQLAAISTVNAAAGQTSGNITIGGVTDVNLGYNGAWVSAAEVNGGKAGNITISSPSAISAYNLNASAINNGTGGNVTLDSTIGSFASGSIWTRSTDNTNSNPCGSCSGTGSGTSGTITFKQSGVTLAMPTVAFATGSDIMVDGTNVGVGPSISFRSANANQLAAISTVNAAAGQTSGDITITGVNDVAFGYNGAWISAAETKGGTAGNVSISSPAAILGNTINASAINNGTGGDISLDSGTGSFSLGSLYTRSTDNTNGNPCAGCSGPGAGTSGSLNFYQSGVLLPSPTVAFAAGSEIMVDGTNPGSTPSIAFVSANTNRLGTVSTVNAAAGQTSGDITIGGLDDVNLGYNGGWVATSELNGGTAGNITISSPKAISTGVLDAAAINNGTGGNITLDSGTNSFETGSIYTRSTNNTNGNPCTGCAGTGTGSAGILTFQQSGAPVTANYTPIGTPELLLDGTNAGSTSTFSLNIAGAGSFGDIFTYNAGAGSAGSVSISSGGGLSVGTVNTTSTGPGATAGSILLRSGAGLAASDLLAGARNNGNGGDITLDSGYFSYKFNNVITRSASGANLFAFSASSTNTGTGTAGIFKLLQSGLPVSNPEVVIANNSQILLDGNNPVTTSDVILNVIGSPQLGTIETVNIFGAGASAGSITLTSTSPLLAGDLVAAGLNNSNGGNITLDSSANDFRLGNLFTRSASGMDATAFSSGATNTGSGSAGILTFKQAGAVITNPRVSFSNGSNVLCDGTNAGATSNISLVLSNSNSLGNIVSLNAGAGSGGNISLTTNFGLVTKNVFSSANGNAGNISLLSGAGISTTGNPIDASSTAGNGGNVFILGNNAVQLSDVLADGGSAGGRVIAVSTTNSISAGNVTSFGGAAQAGSISMVAPGFVNVTSLSSYSPTIAGNIFISAGSGSNNAVVAGTIDSSAAVGGTAGNIYLGANVAGTNGTSATGNAFISFSKQSTYAANATPNPYLFYSTGALSGSNVTLSVTPGSVTINPGGYGTIGASGSPTNITLDLGGDSRTLVPIVVTGNAFIGDFTGDNAVGAAGPAYLQNGYLTMMTTGANLTISGAVTAAPAAGGTAGDIFLYALNQIVFDGASSVGSATGANSVSLYALNGTTATPGSNVSITTPGSIFIKGDIDVGSITTNGGSVSLIAGNTPNSTLAIDAIKTSSSLAAGNIFLSAGGKISTGDLVAAGFNNGTGGNITLNSDIGSFAVGSLVTRSATGTNVSTYLGDTGSGLPGQLVFQQNGGPLATATVGFRNNSAILLDGTSAGSTTSLNLYLANDYAYLPVGDIATVNFGTGPAGSVTIGSCCAMTLSNIYTSAFSQAGDVSLTTTKGFISTKSIIAAGMNNTNGGNISIDSSFGGFAHGSLVTRSTTTSNPMVTDYTADTGSGIAGQLVFKVAGVATANPSVYFINGSSVLVDGTNAASTSTINFNLVGHGSPTYSVLKDVVTINLGGGTTGNITLYDGEPLSIRQVYTSPSATQGNVTISTIGNLTSTGDFRAANINLTTLVDPLGVLSNGNISIGGNLYTATPGSTINLTADGSGSITQTNAAFTSTAPTINISTTTGNIGSAAIPLQTNATTLSATTGYPGYVYINNSGAVDLANAVAGTDLRITAGGTIRALAPATVAGQDSVYFQTTANNGSIIFNTTAVNTKLMTAITHGAGQVVVPAGGGHIQGITLLVDTAQLINGGNVWGSGGLPGSLMTVTRTNGDLNISGGGNISYVIGTGIINIGSNTTNNITFGGGQLINAKPGGTVNIDAQNSININGGQAVAIGGSTFTITSPNLTVGGGGSLNSGPTIRAVTQNIANNGAIFSTMNVDVLTPNSLTISGNGTITGGVITLASGGSINAVQGGYVGTVTGGAASSLSVIGSQPLTTASMTAANGDLTLTSTGGLLQINDGSSLSASANVNLTGTGVNIGVNGGTNVSISAGTLAFGNVYSTNIYDFSYGAVAIPGAIKITGTSGNVNFGSNATLISRGGSIGTTAAGNITLNGPDTFIAQGGNVWFNAGGDVTFNPNVSVTAVARFVPNATPIVIDTVLTDDFIGGDIGINSGSLIANFENYLRNNYDLNRLRNGTYTTIGNVGLLGTTTLYPLGGTIHLEAQGAGSVSVGTSTLNANGSVIYIDPGGNVTLNGAVLGAFGSPLAPFAPPVFPVAPAAVIPILSTSSSATTSASSSSASSDSHFVSLSLPDVVSATQFTQGANARSVPVDQDRGNIQPSTLVDPTQYLTTCVPAPLAGYAEGESWSVASGNCQAFTHQDDDGSAIIGQGGTAVARSEDGLKLREGRLVAISGSQTLLIQTPKGTVSLPPNASAIIEQKSDKVLRLTQLTGQNASVELKGTQQKFSSAPGEEVLIADEGTEDEELIPVDGVDRISIEASIKVAGVQVRRDRFNRQVLAQREKLLNCTNGCIPVRIKQRLNKLEDHLNDTASSEESHLMPIAQVLPAAPRREILCTSSTAGSVIKHHGSASFKVENENSIQLKEGELLVSADTLTAIRTSSGMVTLTPGSIALISKSGDTLKVRSLYDTGVSSIKVYCGKQSMPLTAGQEIIVATTYDTTSKSMRSDSVARRRLKSIDLIDGRNLTHSEYSFLTLLSSSATLSKVMKNSDNDSQPIAERVSKMMVMLGIVTASHGQFNQIPH